MTVICNDYPGRRMIAGFFPAANFTIDACADESRRCRWTQQQMIDTQARIARIVVSEIVPKGVDALLRMQLAQRVSPAHRDQIGERAPNLRKEERILNPVLRLVDVNLGRDNVVVTREHYRFRRG